MAQCRTCKGLGFVNRFGAFDGSTEMSCHACHGTGRDPHAGSAAPQGRGRRRAADGNGKVITLLAIIGLVWLGLRWLEAHHAAIVETARLGLLYVVLPCAALLLAIACWYWGGRRLSGALRYLFNFAAMATVSFQAAAISLGVLENAGLNLANSLALTLALLFAAAGAMLLTQGLSTAFGAHGRAWDLVATGSKRAQRKALRRLSPFAADLSRRKLPVQAWVNNDVLGFLRAQALFLVLDARPRMKTERAYTLAEGILRKLIAKGPGGRKIDTGTWREDTVGFTFGALFVVHYHPRHCTSTRMSDALEARVARAHQEFEAATSERKPARSARQRKAAIRRYFWERHLDRLSLPGGQG